MLKKLIKFTDYNDVKREEDFFFNLSRAELLQMELEEVGGLKSRLERLVQTQNTSEMTKQFRSIILDSYGEKSPDGKRFIKSKELSEAFAQTEAYSELFMEITMNDEAASAFIDGITQSAKDKPIIIK